MSLTKTAPNELSISQAFHVSYPTYRVKTKLKGEGSTSNDVIKFDIFTFHEDTNLVYYNLGIELTMNQKFKKTLVKPIHFLYLVISAILVMFGIALIIIGVLNRNIIWLLGTYVIFGAYTISQATTNNIFLHIEQ